MNAGTLRQVADEAARDLAAVPVEVGAVGAGCTAVLWLAVEAWAAVEDVPLPWRIEQ